MTFEEERLKEIKATIGKFHEEVKSNSITDLIVWIDCKIEYSLHLNRECRRLKEKVKKR